MSTRKFIRFQTTLSRFVHTVRQMRRSLMQWLLRGLLLVGKPGYSRAGFILPTTVILIMATLLVVGSIVYRTYTRTQETVSERQQRVIYNAATPATDRARAKLEFLFDNEREPRYPGGVPSENVLMALMLNGATIGNTTVPAFPGGNDPYTYSDETRINIGTSYNGDTGLDNAWRYRADTDGDGTMDATVVYAVTMRLDDINQLSVATDARLGTRASNLRVRNTPLSAATQGDPLCAAAGGAIQPQQGWVPAQNNSAVLFKNFQVDAYVLPDQPNRPVSTLEMQMDRQIDRGNKWGAWFRYDMEIFPGPPFNWNGAMHTEGSVMTAGGNFTGYMISDPDSCLYTEDASQISVALYPAVTTGNGVVARSRFQGEFISGSMRDDPGSGNRFETGVSARFHLWDGVGRAPLQADADGVTVTAANDSVAPGPSNGPADYALDPVVMQTQGISQHRDPRVANNPRPPAWTSSPRARLRMVTPDQPVTAPYVDDTFRADNRYGPKPNYGSITYAGSIGREIPATNTELIGDEPAPGESTEVVGLDGYWERRARLEGLRLIVGQRLELGDPAGWGGPVLRNLDVNDLDREALRPFMYCADVGNRNTSNSSRCNETRQRRSLWDNLAAVQAMAVYHGSSGDRDRPVACMANTVHPGTPGTLDRSSTFENLAVGLPASAFGNSYLAAGRPPIISDFFGGRGTNGWEYEFRNDYIAAYDNSNSTLRIALRNLAQYAGDPLGGAPTFQPVQDPLGVHPYPSMAMWGDFSVLRRTLQFIEPTSMGGLGRSYASLSPADKTTLHTATCLLGMLAYNLDYLAKFNPADPDLATLMGTAYDSTALERNARTNNANQYYAGLRGAIRALVNGASPLGRIDGIRDPNLNDTQDANSVSGEFIGAGVNDLGNTNSRINQPETYVRLLERWRDQTPANGSAGPQISGTSLRPTRPQMNQYIALAQLIITKEQVARDRNWGFFGMLGTDTDRRATLSRDNPAVPTADLAGTYGTATVPANGCGGMLDTGVGDSIRYLCSWRPRYPILFSLFPAEGFANRTRTSHGDVDQSVASEGRDFVRDRIDSSGDQQNYIASPDVNDGVLYRVIPQSQMIDLVSAPRALGAWQLPIERLTNGPGRGVPHSPTDTLVKVCFNNTTVANQVCLSRSNGVSAANQTLNGEQYWRVPFKDTAFFNGREMLSIRALDVNLDFLRRATTSLTDDTWLPRSGIIFAFREDAVSESNITRRKNINVDWSGCATEVSLRTDNNCWMVTRTNAYASLDPPLADNNLISPKPVDYYPDPDRRPNGFRLRRGETVSRTGDEGRGLSFISDNPVYIQGNFNLHNSATNPEEEFNETAGNNYENFYQRSTLNGDFAVANRDSWRPSEVLADAITILSNNFCDGSILDGITNSFSANRYNCTGGSSSYQNQNRPNTTPNEADSTLMPGWRWFHTFAVDGMGYHQSGGYAEGDSPIYMSPNGNPWMAIDINAQAQEPIYNGTYQTFSAGRSLNGAVCGQRVNAIIVSGLIPSRAGNSYGGLHNFPRFLENWGSNCNLFIQGSLVQLNFSTYATGPFDQDSWEVGSTPVAGAGANEMIGYYSPPARRWGYDVGLQYAPAGPVARRFTSLQPQRNEFYSEPPSNDPYMQTLLQGACASLPPGQRPPRCS